MHTSCIFPWTSLKLCHCTRQFICYCLWNPKMWHYISSSHILYNHLLFPLVKNLKVNQFTLLFSGSWMKPHIWVVGPPKLLSIHKYYLIPPMLWIPNISRSSCQMGYFILCPNWIEDFWKFISWPYTTSYSFRILRMVWHLCFCALQIKRLSSAKRRWDIDGHALATFIHVNCFSFSAFLLFAIKVS